MTTKGRKSSLTEQETDQHREPLRERILTRVQLKDEESDRESCASHRSRDSLDLDAEFERMGGSQQDLRRFASMEGLDQELGSRELEQIGYPVTTEVTLQDCQGEPPPPHHLVGQLGALSPPCLQDGCEVQSEQGQPEIRIEEPYETDDADVTVTEFHRDGESTHSHKEWCEQGGTVSPELTKLSAEPPGEGDANTTLQEGSPDQSTAAAHSPILSQQDMEEDIPNVGATLPNTSQQGHQEHLLLLQERPEIGTKAQHSEHSQSHEQEVLGGVGGADVRYHPLPTDEDSYEQGWEVSKELSVSSEVAPYRADEPVAVVFGGVCDCAEEQCGHQTCWEGKVVSEEGVLELWLERGSGRSVRYPPLVPRRCKKEGTDTEEMV